MAPLPGLTNIDLTNILNRASTPSHLPTPRQKGGPRFNNAPRGGGQFLPSIGFKPSLPSPPTGRLNIPHPSHGNPQFVAPIGIATPGAYGTTPPVGPGAATPPAGTPGQSSGPVTPTLDSTALGNIAANDFKVNNEINALNQRGAYADTDLQRALGQLTNQTNLQDRAAQERANSQGLLSSSTIANQLGQIGQSGGDRQTSLNTSNARLHASITDQIAGLQGDVPIYDQEQAAAAAERASAADAANKALGMPIPTAPAAPAAPTVPVPHGPQAPAGHPAGVPVLRGTALQKPSRTLAHALARKGRK